MPPFNNQQTGSFTHQWIDGNIFEAAEMTLRFPTDEEVVRYLSRFRFITPYDRNGDPGQTKLEDQTASARELFEAVASDLSADIPDDQVEAILSATVMNALPIRPFFRRGDEGAPPAGETVIQLTCWAGQAKPAPLEDAEAEQQAESAEAAPLENQYSETKLYFRTPKPDDIQRWEMANDKHTFQRDAKGRVTFKRSKLNVQGLFELFYGSELKQMEGLFLRGENYDGPVPFLHLYFGASVLLAREQNLKQLAKRVAG